MAGTGMIGTKLAHYEITSHLGSGGMGEVYRATDTKLNRGVAIKLLPAAFSTDAQRLSRFEREAQVLASLNHPNIASIYGIEESGDIRCIVMELVEGESLQARIQRGPIPLDDALKIAKQIAEALEAAHEKGVIHRDLKPANVMLTDDGKIKVLDFGLAKAYDSDLPSPNLSNSPTMLSLAGTNVGIILGTASYMSPEQAKGRSVDRRTDIFAFGCVFYEMLTGKRAFDGDDVSDILGAVLRIQPDWSQLPGGLPARVDNLLRLCLEKNPKNRRSDATDLRLDIEQLLREPEPATPSGKIVEFVKPPLWKRAIPIAAALLMGGLVGGLALWKLQPEVPLPVTRFTLTLPERESFPNLTRAALAISPDGTQIVYVSNFGGSQRLMRRNLAELDARPIPGTESLGGPRNPVFSPDGKSIAFYAVSERTLKRIAVTGGASVTLCAADPPTGMSWGENGIVFAQAAGGIERVSENGGKPEVLVAAENGEFVQGPRVLPDGTTLLFTIGNGDTAKIFVQPLKPGGTRQLLVDGGSDARYVSTGHILYAYQGTLFAVPFDLKRLQKTGGPVPVVEGVFRGATGASQFSVSNTGSIIYVPGPVSASSADFTIALLDWKGDVERLMLPPKAYMYPRLSPDGKQVAVSTDEKTANVWIVDLSKATAPRQLTLGGSNRYPVWSSDGKRIAFQSDREGDMGIFWQAADGTGTAERLTKPEQGIAHIPDSWSPDNKRFSYTAVKGTEASVWIFSLQDKKATVFAEKTGTHIGRSAFSPDGQWLAYQSLETGTGQIFVQPFPATGAKYPVVKGGHPFWSADGRSIIYNPGRALIGMVTISTKPTFSFSEPTILPGGLHGVISRNPATEPRIWDNAPDGKRILGIAQATPDEASAGTLSQIRVVLNWTEELKQKVPVK
jgi:serine/threonine-protein kinase